MSIVIGDRKLSIKCNHSGCASTIGERRAKATPQSVREKAAEQGWSIRDTGDYCPQHS